MANFDRLVSLARRDLGADDVRVLEAGEATPEGALRCVLPDGRALVAIFATPPPDAEARLRRLEMLVASFRDTLDPPAEGRPLSRPPPAHSLHEELRALAERAGAIDAVVIDARSPIVWGAADADRANPERQGPLAEVRSIDERRSSNDAQRRTAASEEPNPHDREPSQDVEPPREEEHARASSDASGSMPTAEKQALAASDGAIAAVRALSVIPSLHRGGHLHHSVRATDFGYVARSFAAIYVLIVVFDAPFDELRTERAIAHALPAIERLIVALPPLDPSPMAGAMAIRRGRRR